MEAKKLFGALRATTLGALCAGGLTLAACSSSGRDDGMRHDENNPKMDHPGEKSCSGEKNCGEKSCGDKSGG